MKTRISVACAILLAASMTASKARGFCFGVDAGPYRNITIPDSDPLVVTLEGSFCNESVDEPDPMLLKWQLQRGPGDVTFADDTAADTTATFSAPGIYYLLLTGTNGVLTASDSVTIAVNEPRAPAEYQPPPPPPPPPSLPPVVFSDSLTARPDPAVVGTIVYFQVVATDVNNSPLTYAWSFGDGTTSADRAPSHTYSAAGLYTIAVTVSDGSFSTTATRVLTVNQTSAPSMPQPLNLTNRTRVRLNFRRVGKDQIRLQGVLSLPDPLPPTGSRLDVNVGGATGRYSLNAKGRGRSAKGSARVNPESGYFNIIMKGTFAELLADEGLVNANIVNSPVTIAVEIMLNGDIYTGERTLLYTARANRDGRAK